MNKLVFAALLLAASSAQAGVHKCKSPDGRIVYTDKGCPQGQELGRDHADGDASQGSNKDAAKAPNADNGGRQDFYRESVKSAEQSAPKP